jgi:hypothetical protein
MVGMQIVVTCMAFGVVSLIAHVVLFLSGSMFNRFNNHLIRIPGILGLRLGG